MSSTADRFELEVARNLADQSLVGIAILEDDRFAYVNARFAETFGYRPDAMLTIPALAAIAYSSRLRVTQHVRECLAGEPHPPVIECEGVKKDGSPVYAELGCSRLELGDRCCAILMVADITARKLAERRVQALNRQLAELAVQDPLTGLYNRRFTEASLERELLQAERSGSPVSLVMCDIDDFKAVNEAFGREGGDQVLKSFGDLLKRRCRKSDIACRCGGEEFLVVFPGMPAEVAAAWADKARAAIAAVRIAKDASSLQITASFGVATYPEHGQTWQDLIAAVDAAQYSAKVAGGNQVIAALPTDDGAPEWIRLPTASGAELKVQDLSRLAAREG